MEPTSFRMMEPDNLQYRTDADSRVIRQVSTSTSTMCVARTAKPLRATMSTSSSSSSSTASLPVRGPLSSLRTISPSAVPYSLHTHPTNSSYPSRPHRLRLQQSSPPPPLHVSHQPPPHVPLPPNHARLPRHPRKILSHRPHSRRHRHHHRRHSSSHCPQTHRRGSPLHCYGSCAD